MIQHPEPLRRTPRRPTGVADRLAAVRHVHAGAPRFPAQAVWCALPQRITPQRATRARQAPRVEDDWWYEIRLDGMRLMARMDGQDVRLVTGDGDDCTARLQPLCRTLAGLRLLPGWYDGELVVLDERGLPDPAALQRALQQPGIDTVVFYLFDLPYLDNYDLRVAPLAARRALLERLLSGAAANGMVRLSQTFAGPLDTLLLAVRRMGLTGVIAKRRDAPYRPGRQTDWLQLDGDLSSLFAHSPDVPQPVPPFPNPMPDPPPGAPPVGDPPSHPPPLHAAH